jgi:hypothetical protein
MNPLAKYLISFGIVLIMAGLFWHFTKGSLPLGRLPGDFHIKSGNSHVFIPVTTSILLSIVFTIILYFIRR